MTRAEVLAEYLGINLKTHPQHFFARYECSVCGQDVASEWGFKCPSCTKSRTNTIYVLLLPDPLAPGTAADAWLGVLVRDRRVAGLVSKHEGSTHMEAEKRVWRSRVQRSGQPPEYCATEDAGNPTPAIVRTMMAADSAFREKMEGAEG